MAEIPGMLHGACSRTHAVATIGAHRVRAEIEAGALVSLWPRVLVLGPRQLDPWTRAAAASLSAGAGAVVWGQTAALLHGCHVAAGPLVHVAVPYDRWCKPKDGLKIRHGRISAKDIRELDGLAVVAFEVAIAELLCTAKPGFALACADAAAASQPRGQRAAFAASIAGYLARRPDRRGFRRASDLLELVSGDAESPRESRLRLLVVGAGFPLPAVQHPVRDLDGRLVWRLDLAWPDQRIALEYDGYEAHDGRFGHVHLDEARDEDLRRRGWIVLRVRAADLDNPERLLDELTAAFRRRAGRVGGWRAAG